MKHLKKFNEELKPDTYRRAGNRLKNIGQSKRGDNLISYGDSRDTEKKVDTYTFYIDQITYEPKQKHTLYKVVGKWDYSSKCFKISDDPYERIQVEGPGNLSYSSGRARTYVANRKEARKLVGFLNANDHKGIKSINGFYSDDIDISSAVELKRYLKLVT